MNVTATEAKNRLGQVLEHAQRAPVFIDKAGRRHSVVLSIQRYEDLIKAEAGRSLKERTREFNEKYKDWIAEQNERYEKRGLWNEEFRRW